jgi:hypothetical protein
MSASSPGGTRSVASNVIRAAGVSWIGIQLRAPTGALNE